MYSARLNAARIRAAHVPRAPEDDDEPPLVVVAGRNAEHAHQHAAQDPESELPQPPQDGRPRYNLRPLSSRRVGLEEDAERRA